MASRTGRVGVVGAWFVVVLLVSAVVDGQPARVGLDASTAGERGAQLYRRNGCGSCHGPAGRGDGPIAGAVDPAPTDLTRPDAFRIARDETAIAVMLAVGLRAASTLQDSEGHALPHHSGGMPAFPHLTEGERRALALFVLSLPEKRDVSR